MKLRPIIAHRGFSDLYPENTIRAFEEAIKLGVKCIETDVTVLKDKTPVLFHDYYTKDHSDFNGIIHDLKKEDLQKVDAGSWKSSEFTGMRIVMLDELLTLIKKYNIILNLELKGEAGKNESYWNDIVDIAVKKVHKYGVEKLVFYSSFELPMLYRLKEQDSNAQFGILLWENTSNWREIARGLNSQAIHLYDQTVTQDLVSKIRESEYEVYVYTVNDENIGEDLINIGVNGIFTDRPQIFDKKFY